jgi:cobalt-zinc-cadmium efflux system outer membrane protein
MPRRWLIALAGFMCILNGCLYNARERADEAVCSLAMQPYDQQPAAAPEAKSKTPASPPSPEKKSEATSLPPLDVQSSEIIAPGAKATQLASDVGQSAEKKPRLEPPIPPEVPGSETPRLPGKASPESLQQIYPDLPPLPEDPVAQPSPDGKPYTLSALQQIAAANDPKLRQAAFDVEAARGNLIQARAYPNPTIGWNVQPSNDGSTAGVQGPFIDQTIKTGGKLKLAGAAAEMDLRNAELALRRARSDLATQVRNAYFAVLVAREAVRVNKALASFTDQMYRLQAKGLLPGAVSAPYEPAALRAQAYTTRLAYKQAIQTYTYAWKQLVAALGLRQLPLSELSGRIDAVIPNYDYDVVLAHVLRNHTDVLTAQNAIEKARYNLKLAQVTPVPDVDFNVSVLKEYSLPPKQFVPTATIGFPFPIWNRNRGGIIAAEGAWGRAVDEPHRVEQNLTTLLAAAYTGYKQNLDALEYYRRFILPDQVRYYRGVVDRRQFQLDPTGGFGDLVTAQQTLVTNVSSYLTVLGALWSSVVSVADLLQTDDLFQLAQSRAIPALPELESLPPWPCCHECLSASAGQHGGSCIQGAMPAAKVMPNGMLPDHSGVTRPKQELKGARTTEAAQSEDLGHATHASDTRLENDLRRPETTVEGAASKKLPRGMPSPEIRQTSYPNDPLLLDEPPPVPYVRNKQSAENGK